MSQTPVEPGSEEEQFARFLEELAQTDDEVKERLDKAQKES